PSCDFSKVLQLSVHHGDGTITATSETSTFGTYGQASLGFSAAVAGTGWVGFGRVDYRKGDYLEGLSGTGGIRYQFTPDVFAKMPVKAVVKAPVVVEAVDWTGFYLRAPSRPRREACGRRWAERAR